MRSGNRLVWEDSALSWTADTEVRFTIEDEILISTLDQAATSSLRTVGDFITATAYDITQAVSFTTGSNPGGYIVRGLQVSGAGYGPGPFQGTLKATIHEDAGGLPGAQAHTVGQLPNPTLGRVLINAERPVVLDPDTTYWLLLEVDDAGPRSHLFLDTRRGLSPDHGSEDGWSIAGQAERFTPVDPWRIRETMHILKFAIVGQRASVHTPALSNLASAGTFGTVAGNIEGMSHSTQFHTGGSPGGYEFTGIQLDLWTEPGVEVRVSLFGSDWTRSNPDVPSLAVLEPTSDLLTPGGAPKTFIPVVPVDLDANSTYYVVVEHAGGTGQPGNTRFRAAMARSTEPNPDPGSLLGWRFGSPSYRFAAGGVFYELEALRPLVMTVLASAKEGLKLEHVLVTSAPIDGDTYRAGENIELLYVFNTAVEYVKGGASITVGTDERDAEYWSGSGANRLKYRYRVTSEDVDPDGLSITANSLGATTVGNVKGVGGTQVALELAVGADLGDHKVNGDANACGHLVCADVTAENVRGGRVGATHEADRGVRGILSNRLFQYGGTKYELLELLLGRDSGQLELLLDRAPGSDLVGEGALHVGDRSFHLADAAIQDGHRLVWLESGLQWQEDNPHKIRAVSTSPGKPYAHHANVSDGQRYFTSFTTGPASHSLSGLLFRGTPGTDRFSVAIHADEGGSPASAALHTLGATSNRFRTDVAPWYFRSTGYVLQPHTTYWVGITSNGAGNQLELAFDGDDTSGARGWSLGDDSRLADGSVWWPNPIKVTIFTDPNHIRVSLEGNVRSSNMDDSSGS